MSHEDAERHALLQHEEAEASGRVASGRQSDRKSGRRSGHHDSMSSEEYRGNTSLPRAAFHIFKGNVGAGFFLLPKMFSEAGCVVGSTIQLLCGVVVVDCALMLLRCKYFINRPEVQSYSEVTRFLLGNKMQRCVEASLVISQLGFCLIYMELSSGLFNQVLSVPGGYRLWVVAGTVLVTPLAFVAYNLKLLAIASGLASAFIMFVIGVTAEHTVSHLVNNGKAATAKLAASVWDYPLFLSSQMSILDGIGLVLPIENAVKAKSSFPFLLSAMLACIVLLEAVYGQTSYIAFGTTINNTTLEIMGGGVLTNVSRVLLGVALLLTHPLQLCPAMQIIDTWIGTESSRTKYVLSRVTVCVALSAIAVAVGEDATSLVWAFIGSAGASFLAVILPPFLELKRISEASSRSSLVRATYEVVESKHQDDDTGEESPKASPESSWLQRPFCSFAKFRCYTYAVLGIASMIAGITSAVLNAAA